ncbi:MAG: class I SAM-dependent methyltransferase [Acidobacteria bacterium]|nr:class I SAM-dependent methyltransferase [Acidobacteriota bacterium]
MTVTCPACGGELDSWGAASDKLTGTGKHLLDSCRNCLSLVLQSEVERDPLSFYPSNYWYRESDASWLSKLEGCYRRWVLLDHVRFVTRFLRQPGKLLDVGCGSGTFLFLLKRRGYQVLGLDFSHAAAVEAKRRYAIEVKVGSLREQRRIFQAWAPDAVTMFHVLEHVTDPVETLRGVYSVLRPEGQLFLQVPNMGSWQARIFGAHWYGLDVPRHAVNYTDRGLRAVLHRAGFQITHCKRFSLRDNSPSWVSSLVRSIDPLKRRLAGNAVGAADFLYAALVTGLQPIAALEAMCGCGGTLFVRAVRAPEERKE